MSFCPTCGRPRNPDVRFCGGCGSELGGPAGPSGGAAATPGADPAGPATPEPAGPGHGDAPAELTRWDAPVGATRLDNSLDAAPPGRYDTWYAEPSAAGTAAPPPADPPDAGQWLAGDTVTTGPAGPGGYTPPTYPPPAGYPQPPVPSGPQPRPGNRRTAGLVIAAVLVVLAAGGGAYALAGEHRHTGAQSPPQSSVTATPDTTAPATAAPTSPVVNASASPTASPSASVTPSPTNTGTVRAAAGAASDPAAPRVLAYLNRYFSAINTHDYDAYQGLLDAGQQAADPRSAFDSGYATTRDSNEVLTGIEAAGGGQVTANVTFTSRQSPANSVDGSACNNWQVSLYLVPRGSGYAKTATPPGYQARYTDC